jgi:hypothetical protein
MAPGSVPAGSGRAGNFSSSEILERVALGCGRVGLWPWVLGPGGAVVGGGSFWSLFRFAIERASGRVTGTSDFG